MVPLHPLDSRSPPLVSCGGSLRIFFTKNATRHAVSMDKYAKLLLFWGVQKMFCCSGTIVSAVFLVPAEMVYAARRRCRWYNANGFVY